MDEARFEADCGRCAALCCVAFAFDRSAEFGFDKAAEEPCRNLNGRHLCTIHGRLEASGFAGCVRFDCRGAGQRVTQDLFGGRSWRDEPALRGPMSAAFRAMRRVQQDLELLVVAGRLPLSDGQEERRAALLARVDPAAGWTPAALDGYAASGAPEAVATFLGSLRAEATGLRTT